MSTIAVIPARAGSKGIADKNIHAVGGVSLLELAVRAGRQSSRLDRILISTDSSKYEDIARQAGADSLGLRPTLLAGDRTTTFEVIEALLEQLPECEQIVLLQPTSPIRDGELIDRAIAALADHPAAVTVCRLEEPHPYKLFRLEQDRLAPFIEGARSDVPRQSLPPAYQLTGAVYAIRKEALLQHRGFVPAGTAAIESTQFVNIDQPQDLLMLDYHYRQGALDHLLAP
ncbi:acylneuraminate cytidylyltransferase family protein [Marinobacterium sedimentorum]|uniref:acylneuraminate cytidylyltransferase family protein n=1 Tax=Marinobacterium sedimentorum TaxID=2927804 RepID=UPI0020C5D587|nr:acylneuraminate cytidylyltransferase family protein [Marinobacterium sedimentorum]MCP8686259.1 acylneuraminate cytidylyltransferase family protein [Marinobacterium sedimentorum]